MTLCPWLSVLWVRKGGGGGGGGKQPGKGGGVGLLGALPSRLRPRRWELEAGLALAFLSPFTRGCFEEGRAHLRCAAAGRGGGCKTQRKPT